MADNTPHRVAVLSDTHGKLRPEVEAQLRTAELILHAGDITGRALLERLESIAPVTAVRGNGDKTLPELPEERRFELFGMQIYMVHNIRQRSPLADGAGLVLYGHTHNMSTRLLTAPFGSTPAAAGRGGLASR